MRTSPTCKSLTCIQVPSLLLPSQIWRKICVHEDLSDKNRLLLRPCLMRHYPAILVLIQNFLLLQIRFSRFCQQSSSFFTCCIEALSYPLDLSFSNFHIKKLNRLLHFQSLVARQLPEIFSTTFLAGLHQNNIKTVFMKHPFSSK